MDPVILFGLNSILLGIGLAMDAFTVSVANGLSEPLMRKRKALFIAGVFAVFQGIMPLLGWLCVHSIVVFFREFEKWTPVIALVLLGIIGGKMLVEGIVNKKREEEKPRIGVLAILAQGVATSIDALSVGFTIAEYEPATALICALIIASVTFLICLGGIAIGKKFGMKFSRAARIAGGAILIAIGIEIFIKGFFTF